jgi:hypothetical protein
LNGRVTIHITVLKAVRNMSTGFIVETNNSSGFYGTMNGGSVSAYQIMVTRNGD